MYCSVLVYLWVSYPSTVQYLAYLCGGGGWGANQAYSQLSTTHGHITDCKLDSVVYAGVCVVS